MSWKRNLLPAALSGALLLGGITLSSTTAQARDKDRGCRDVSREERELQRNIRRYGFLSPQAQHDRRELARMRESCERGNRRFWGRDGDHDRDDRGFWRGDGDHDRDDRRGWRDRDDRWHGRDHDRDGWRHRRDRDRDHDRDDH